MRVFLRSRPAVLLLVFALFLLSVPAAFAGRLTRYSADVYMNGKPHPDPRLRVSESGEIHVPLVAVCRALGLPAPEERDGVWRWMDSPLPEGVGQISAAALYVPLTYLESMGLHAGTASFGSAATVCIDNIRPIQDQEWTRELTDCAHATGATAEGKTYTNSKEAFEYNYLFGFTAFEVDLHMTSDGHVAALHNWNQFRSQCAMGGSGRADLAAFLAARIYDRYTPLDFEGIAQLMQEHPDVLFILDTKRDEPQAMYQEILRIAEEVNPEILDRLVPYAYDEESLDLLLAAHPWKRYIYTLYSPQKGQKAWDMLLSGYRRGVRVFSNWSSQLDDRTLSFCQAAGLTLYTFVVNDRDEYEYLSQTGVVAGIMSDFLTPYSSAGGADTDAP